MPDARAAAHTDPRIEAFAALVRSVDQADWKRGQLATRELRGLGFSVCLVKPPGDRGRP